MELSKLVEEILKITNESPYGWLDMDSVEAGEIQKLLNKSIHNVSQQRELLIAFNTMREFDIKHDDIEESIEYFLKNKESYL